MIYDSITQLLLKNPKYSLELGYWDSARIACINEPNPRARSIVIKSDGLTIREYITRPMDNYYLVGRDALESLDLLERACQGEKVESTANFEGNEDKAIIPGKPHAQGGIDNLLFNHISFHVQEKEKNLVINAYIAVNRPVTVFSNQVKNLDEAIDIYEKDPISTDTLRYVKNVVIDFGYPKTMSFDPDAVLNRLYKDDKLIKQYHERLGMVLKELERFNISRSLRNSIEDRVLCDVLDIK